MTYLLILYQDGQITTDTHDSLDDAQRNMKTIIGYEVGKHTSYITNSLYPEFNKFYTLAKAMDDERDSKTHYQYVKPPMYYHRHYLIQKYWKNIIRHSKWHADDKDMLVDITGTQQDTDKSGFAFDEMSAWSHLNGHEIAMQIVEIRDKPTSGTTTPQIPQTSQTPQAPQSAAQPVSTWVLMSTQHDTMGLQTFKSHAEAAIQMMCEVRNMFIRHAPTNDYYDSAKIVDATQVISSRLDNHSPVFDLDGKQLPENSKKCNANQMHEAVQIYLWEELINEMMTTQKYHETHQCCDTTGNRFLFTENGATVINLKGGVKGSAWDKTWEIKLLELPVDVQANKNPENTQPLQHKNQKPKANWGSRR